MCVCVRVCMKQNMYEKQHEGRWTGSCKPWRPPSFLSATPSLYCCWLRYLFVSPSISLVSRSSEGPEKENYYFFIYDVITWEKEKKARPFTTSRWYLSLWYLWVSHQYLYAYIHAYIHTYIHTCITSIHLYRYILSLSLSLSLTHTHTGNLRHAVHAHFRQHKHG